MRRILTGVLLVSLIYGFTVPAGPRAGGRAASPASAGPDKSAAGRAQEEYGRLPLSFEPNQGQAASQVKFLARGQGYVLLLTPGQAVLRLGKGKSEIEDSKSEIQKGSAAPEPRSPDPESRGAAVLRMDLVGANPRAQVMGLEELPGKSNYLLGNEPSQWRANIPTFARVQYREVYPGVDLIYYGKQGQLEYDFVVAPGADPGVIRLGIESEGLQRETRNSKVEFLPSIIQTPKFKVEPRLQIDASGDLIAQTSAGAVRFHKPAVYQGPSPVDHPHLTTSNPKSKIQDRNPLDGHYVLHAHNQIGFEIPGYDRTLPLVIDPVLSYSTYLGGSVADIANGIAVDGSGNAYVTGSTLSTNFPTVTPLQSASGGDSDVFVAKLNATGTALTYSTYLGGSAFDKGTGIAVDSAGNAYITGYTSSSNFPTSKGSFQSAYGGGTSDAFVAKLNPAGSALVYSSFLGGSDSDFGQGIALDSAGNAYLTGSTQSTNFPTANPFQKANGGGTDVFVAKMNAAGSALTYSTYLGGSAADSGQGIAVDASGSAYITGFTFSNNFPTASPIQAASGGGTDAFVTKLNSAGSGLLYSTYLGGSGLDRGFGIAVDSSGSAYITGDTQSSNLPATTGAFQTTNNGNGDAFVAKLSPAGTAPLVYLTLLGGTDIEQGVGIAVDGSGEAFVTGFTQSSNFPLLDALQTSIGGGTCGSGICPDAFVTKLNPQGSAVLYSTYLGGTGADFGQAIALDVSANAYVAGGTASTNFPSTPGAPQVVFGGSASTGDAFVAKIAPNDLAGISLSPQVVAFGNQGQGSRSPAQAVTVTNIGSVALNISSIGLTGPNAADFALVAAPATATVPACPVSGPVGPTCAIYLAFTPSTKAAETASLSITDNAAGSPHSVSLTGTGIAPAPAVTLSPTSLTFAAQAVGTTSGAQVVTLTNNGASPLNITSIAITGDYGQSNNCSASPPSTKTPAILNPGASCFFTVTFTPAGAGSTARAGSLSITDDAAGSPQTVGLTGTGTAVFTLASTASSATVTVGTTSTTFTVSAAAPRTFTTAIALACAISSGASCSFNPTSITPGQTSKLTVNGLSATTTNPLSFTVNGTSGTQTASVSLTVALADFSVSVTPPLAAIAAGASAAYTVSITPSNGFNQAVTFSCLTPGIQAATCSFAPPTVTPNGTITAVTMMSIKTTVHSSTVPRTTPRPILPPGWLGMVWSLGLISWAVAAMTFARRRGQQGLLGPAQFSGRFILNRLLLGVLVFWMAVLAGCNNYGVGPIGPLAVTGTAPGTYTTAVIATSKTASGTSVTRSATVNLTVS